ncbi:hypothetical protein NOS3756_44330 [Nostoc sp. NIES-3756]|uniref:hypothetical protein n=1 Tax=Nostoc sp. NIES-3756 TaxID=1751286 RepID=UPI000722614E|nr:hypothetical protein [Nostoc sp. NIES-3756]BAT55446.1 hypothetical protein NOS3756_44330 [Nostoc sp. NIES-3756]BAY36791.1 hypothetical protein NIES2111_11220 [Nostoc sp. NIES-2111]
MLAQFQSLYPNGSLISELVEIFQGKYIVRASVQIEGVTRATGMAAAETVEVAEDQARIRALTVLGITDAPQASVSSTPAVSAIGYTPPEAIALRAVPEAIAAAVKINPTLSEPTYTPVKSEDFASKNWSISSNHDENKDVLNSSPAKSEVPKTSKTNTQTPDFSPSLPTTTYQEPEFEPPIEDLSLLSSQQPDLPTIPEVASSNVTPFTPRSYTPQENVTSISGGTGKKKKKSEPVDLSDVIAKTDVELQRLGWTPEQGREYLIKTYGKRGRTLLTEDELHSFLKYLESQPDPIAGF